MSMNFEWPISWKLYYCAISNRITVATPGFNWQVHLEMVAFVNEFPFVSCYLMRSSFFSGPICSIKLLETAWSCLKLLEMCVIPNPNGDKRLLSHVLHFTLVVFDMIIFSKGGEWFAGVNGIFMGSTIKITRTTTTFWPRSRFHSVSQTWNSGFYIPFLCGY